MPGVVLVLIGALIMLHNFHVINFRWENIFSLWPVFLIMGGVNLLLSNNPAPWATATKVAVVVACFCLLAFVPNNHRYFWNHSHGNWNFSDDDDDNDTSRSHGVLKVEGATTYSEPYVATIKSAHLNISGGASEYTIKDTTGELFNAVTKEFYNKYDYTHSLDSGVFTANLKMRDPNGKDFKRDNDKANSAVIRLNTAPEWDIQVDALASKLNFDLSKFKIKSVVVNGGAASFDLKLGQPLERTNIEISTAASGATLEIPETAACQITTSSFLSSDDFDGFDNKGDHRYETPGFATAKNKIYITLKGAFSGFEVKRY